MEKERVLIIGSGIAAMTLAKQLPKDKEILLITKGKIDDNNSVRAQGGIAAVTDAKDSWRAHFYDTMQAGYQMTDPEAVTMLVKKGPTYIQKMVADGLMFDKDESGHFLLGQEGAHSQRRILHAGGDQTGKKIMDYLFDTLPDNVQIITNITVVDLLVSNNQCYGVLAVTENGETCTIYANHIVLATGGCGALYQFSSNDPNITGDGIAMAYRAGAKITDLEFMQFHPTLLVKDTQSYGLVSEAVRGEGARLVTETGEAIMDKVHPLKDLAPRDVVARTIQAYLAKGTNIYLGITMIERFRHRFPMISALCDQANLDLSTGLLPVAPGAHFLMGGVATNLAGETSIKQLYAVGEVAASGVHGANRLASNSLLEAIVFANRLARAIKRAKPIKTPIRKSRTKTIACAEKQLVLPSKTDLQTRMTLQAGIIREQSQLSDLKQWLESFNIHQDIDHVIPSQRVYLNQLLTCWLIVTSALARTESRGAHWRSDYPTMDSKWEGKHITYCHEQLGHKCVPGGER